jgi:hypothetical protein
MDALAQVIRRFNPPVGTLARIFASYARTHPVKESDLAELQSALIERGTAAQQVILRRSGKLLSSEELGNRLGRISRQAVNERKENGKVLAISFANRRGDFFPEFQLDGSSVRPWIAQLLARIPDGWSALSFLTAGREEFEGESHLQRILKNVPGAIEAMISDADVYRS